MVHIYTGDGKGKTTAAVGLAVRAAASGKNVLFFQFLKCDNGAERKILSATENITVECVGRDIPFLINADEKLLNDLRSLYKEKLNEFYENSDKYNFYIFDEAVSAVDAGIVRCEDVLRFSDFGELVLTGRGDIEAYSANADYITEMKKIKHPYDSGVKARSGVEY